MDNTAQTIPTGYKLTEVGMVPNDWDVNELSSVIKVFRGGSPRPIESYLTTSPLGINWVKIGDVKNGAKYIERTAEKIIPEGVSRSRKVHSGDFLLSNSMSFGRPYILKIDGCIHDGWLVLQDYQDTYDKEFLYYILGSEIVIKQYLSKAAGSSVLNLNKELVSTVKLLTPKLPEQSAIALVLSNLDSLIQKTEKLIAKKKAIKEGAMQELLTGKRRLLGFSGEWNQISLVNVCIPNGIIRGPFGGSLKKEVFKSEGIKVYEQRNAIYQNIEMGSYYIDPTKYSELSRFEVFPKDFIVSCSGTIGKIYQIPNNAPKGIINQALLILRINQNLYDYDYFYQYFNWDIFQDQITESTQGGAMKNLVGMDIFRKTNLFYPPTKEEQKAISTILNYMDVEIEKLGRKLKKYKQIKQGATQVLLTGKIRLIKN